MESASRGKKGKRGRAADSDLSTELTRIEECGGRVREVLLGHEVIGLKDSLDVIAVDADGNTHEHLLRALDNLRAVQCIALQRERCVL